MTVIAEISIDADEFLLGRLIAEHPGLSVELERIVPAEKRVMPYIWGYGPDLDEFESAMNDSPNVNSIAVLDEYEDRSLYKIEWKEPAEQLIIGIADTDASIIEAHSDEEWLFQIRFEDRTGLARFNEYCLEHDITYRLDRLSSLSELSPGGRKYDLTAAQYEALSLAVDRGYFRVPREVEYAELAQELGVSVQALSERVRRGADKVLRSALAQPEDGNR